MSNLPAVLEQYVATVTPLKTGGRVDMHVAERGSVDTEAFVDTDIVAQMRVFFDKLDHEIIDRRDDVVAMVNALARMEALLADVRAVTATARARTAEALADGKIRRLTIDNVATVEGTSEAERTEWRDVALLFEMLAARHPAGLVDADTGELVRMDLFVDDVLSWFRVQWRLTPIRAAGLDPDDYSTMPTNEDGTPLRTPTVRMHDNAMRKVGR